MGDVGTAEPHVVEGGVASESRHRPVVVARLWGRYSGTLPSRAPIILGLDRRRYRTVCIYLKQSSDAPNPFAERGCAVHYISRWQFFRVFYLPAVIRLARVLRREQVDILHCHLHQATVYGTIAARLARVPVVISHVHGLHRTRRSRRRWINRLVLPRVNRILAVGEATRQDVLATNPFLSPDKVISLGNSIDVSHYAEYPLSREEARGQLGLGGGVFVFGAIGRLVPGKNHSGLIEAFAHVHRRCPESILLIAGEGRLGEALREQAQRLGLGDSVRFLGYMADVRLVLRALDVFVLPSLWEGLPRSLLEAMAIGVPCVGSTCAGIPEILEGGRYGMLVEADQTDQLVEAMTAMVQMPADRKDALVLRARQRVLDHYDHRYVLERLEAIYEDELSRTHAYR